MYVVIEKNTGKIVWAAAAEIAARDDHDPAATARKFAQDNPGKSYYAAYLYLEVITGMTEEKTQWTVQ